MHAFRPLKTSVAGLTAAALALTLTACGGGDSDQDNPSMALRTASNGDVFNQADVDFATHMIPHHAQAVEMVNMTIGRKLDPEVQQLADGIRDAQTPEVQTMSEWLTSWGKEVPATSIDHEHADMNGMDSTDGVDSNMPGMMTPDEMHQLDKAPGAHFQAMWLEMMLEHHEGAIEMAETEKQDGAFPGAVRLAGSIITSQQAEVDQISRLLGES